MKGRYKSERKRIHEQLQSLSHERVDQLRRDAETHPNPEIRELAENLYLAALSKRADRNSLAAFYIERAAEVGKPSEDTVGV